jgi:hypothetical protein
MNQIVRRVTYLLAGAIPASLGVAFASFAGPWVIAAATGAIGLIIASLVRFPVPPKGYGSIAVLLFIGLSAAIPFGTTFLLGSLAGGVSAKTWPSLALIVWVFVGPVLCATHFLLASRSAPNNSFKPRPLRGSA